MVVLYEYRNKLFCEDFDMRCLVPINDNECITPWLNKLEQLEQLKPLPRTKKGGDVY